MALLDEAKNHLCGEVHIFNLNKMKNLGETPFLEELQRPAKDPQRQSVIFQGIRYVEDLRKVLEV